MLERRERLAVTAGHSITETSPSYANNGPDGGDQALYPTPSPLTLLQMGFAGGQTLGWTLRVNRYGKAGRESNWAGERYSCDAG